MKTNIKKETVKSYALFVYVTLTLLGAYTAAVFYFGTQFNAHADNQSVPSPKVQAAK